MSENNQNPREYDAVLGGNSPPPVDGVVLGGIEGLQRRLETGNIQQRVDSLADAVKYGDAGVDLLINALEDSEIQVRAKAFEILKDNNSEKVQEIVEKGIPLRKGDKLYCVYASDIDYNDEFYNILDSFEKAENSCYAGECELIHKISCYVYKNQAKAVAKSLHQTILSCTKLSEFCRRYNLQINEHEMNHLKTLFDYTDEYMYELNYHNGLATISGLNDFCIFNDIPLESRVGQEQSWDFKDRILKHLKETRNDDKLSLFLDFLQIGKFAFVEEEIVNQNGYLNNGKI